MSGQRLLTKPFLSPRPVVSFGQIKPSGSGEENVWFLLPFRAYENNMLLTASEKRWEWEEKFFLFFRPLAKFVDKAKIIKQTNHNHKSKITKKKKKKQTSVNRIHHSRSARVRHPQA